MKWIVSILIACMANAAVVNPWTLFPAATGAGYSSAVLADNPVGYWRLDETSGATAIDNRGTNNLTYNSAPTWSYAGAVIGNSAALHTTNIWAERADSAPLDITGALTLECWIYPTNVALNSAGIIAKYVGSPGVNRSYVMALQTNRVLQFAISSDGTFSPGAKTVEAAGTIPTNAWTHVAAVFTPSTSIVIYTNGVPSATNSTSIPASIFNGAAPLMLGMQFATNAIYRFPGALDEAAIYNTALSAARIQAHHDARTAP